MLRDQLFKTSGLQFDNRLFGPEKHTGLQTNRGPFLKSPENSFWARKAIRKTSTRLFCEAGIFIGCKGNKIKTAARFLGTPSF